jgi:hypothetical protein
MPRPSKPVQATAALPNMAALEVLEQDCLDELHKWNEVSKATRLDYTAKSKRLAEAAKTGGYPFHEVTPATRKLYVAAAKWTARKELRSIMHAAKKAKKGKTGKEMFAVRVAMWEVELEKARLVLQKLEVLAAIDCNQETGLDRKQASHKQKPATDDDLVKFHAWAAAAKSKYADAFMVTEFTGCRGEELGKGIRIETVKINGEVVLHFHIESAKCDGKKKGLDVRCLEVPFPRMASTSVKRRWTALAKKVAGNRGELVVKIEATEGASAGECFTDACRTASKGAGVKVAAYALRNRISSQVKEASKGHPDAAINVALVLGHQTTKTQRHYARAHRGGRGISPIEIKGINVMGVTIRGPAQRQGPPLHIRERVALEKMMALQTASASRPRL